MSLVNIVVIAAQTEPRTNHIDTSCVVKPSQSNINTAKPIHTIGIYCSIGLSPSFLHKYYSWGRKRAYKYSYGKHFYEKNTFLPRFRRMTNRLVDYVINKLRSKTSFASVAKEVNLLVPTVIRIFDFLLTKKHFPQPFLLMNSSAMPAKNINVLLLITLTKLL